MKEKNPLKNEKGIIAESYSELQSISALEKAKESFPTKKASQVSAFKAILQSIEIGILNISDLLQRIIIDVENNEIGKTVVKIGWYKDFNFLLNHLTNILSLNGGLSLNKSKSLDLSKIGSLQKFIKTLRNFDKKFINHIKTQSIDLKEIIGNHSLDNNLTQLIHYSRISNLEIAVWERSLTQTFSPIKIIDYETFIGAKFLHKAVNEVKLEGDTFFTQFRGLHQIPELLTTEINDNIEAAIKLLRNKDLEKCIYHLRIVNILSEGVIGSLLPLINNLTTSDYHQIRENLGLTSGSHSVNIHYHLFRDLYQQISKEFVENYFVNKSDYLKLTSENFLFKTFEIELLELSSFTFRWRNFHIHLPRNNVGGNFTKSLIGSSDAIEAVKKMKSSAEYSDPLNPIKEIYGLFESQNKLYIADYINSENSLDSLLLNETGEITQKRFAHVQDRKGVFANKSSFKPPTKREV